MPKPPDRVVPIKQESLSTGGDAADEDSFLTQALDASEDAMNTAGIALQEPTGGGANSNDDTVMLYRESDKMFFEDSENAAADRVCLSDLRIRPTKCGQVLYAISDTEMAPAIPLLGPGGWLSGGAGKLLIK